MKAKILPNGLLFKYYPGIKKLDLKIISSKGVMEEEEELVLFSIPSTSIKNIKGIKV